jgi:glutathione S-transferase
MGLEKRLKRMAEQGLAPALQILFRQRTPNPRTAPRGHDNEGNPSARQIFPSDNHASRLTRAYGPSINGLQLRRERRMPLKLVVANKAYSSWSLRPWILMAHFHIPFEEVVIPMDQPDTREKMLKYAPTGKCPSLHDRKIAIWESLAIVEYLAEAYPEKAIWPRGRAARAHARSISNEMHAGFLALRQACPTNFRRRPKAISFSEDVLADVARIEALWAGARAVFGKAGPFLFGRFSAADAMYAPVVNRFHAYDVPVRKETRAYMAAVMNLPAWKAWIADAEAEPWRIERYEAI